MKDLNYIEINRDSVLHNVKLFKKLSSNKMAAVVKGNAYGHGLKEMVKILDNEVDYFQVDDLEELLELRKFSKKKALVLGYLPLYKINELTKLNAIPGLYNLESINEFNGGYHLKIDSFLGRQGILTSQLNDFMKKINNKNITGIYTHFSNIEDTSDRKHYRKQIRDFKKAIAIVKSYGLDPKDIHINATSGILVNNDLETTINRLGVGLYGMWPSEKLQNKYACEIGQLKPVIKWVSHIAQVKSIPKGYPIGYGLTYVSANNMKVAIVPQGYSDGYDRKLSSCGTVIIKDSYCKVLGRVAMNMFVVDVTHIDDVRLEDKVVLLGKSGSLEISAEEIAKKTATINYEVTTKISPLLPRIIL